jgi:hypothetical protein
MKMEIIEIDIGNHRAPINPSACMFFPTLTYQVFPRLCEKRSIVAAETGKETPLKRLYGEFFWPAS